MRGNLRHYSRRKWELSELWKAAQALNSFAANRTASRFVGKLVALQSLAQRASVDESVRV